MPCTLDRLYLKSARAVIVSAPAVCYARVQEHFQVVTEQDVWFSTASKFTKTELITACVTRTAGVVAGMMAVKMCMHVRYIYKGSML